MVTASSNQPPVHCGESLHKKKKKKKDVKYKVYVRSEEMEV